MKHKIYSSILAAAALSVLPGCDKENSFLVNTSEGKLNCEALSVDYINRGTRAEQVDPNDFQVNFVNTATNEVVRSYLYADMPEIVALPVGDYKAVAVYGDNDIDAEWENPFYSGASPFSIEAGKITDDVEPIECYLNNIKVQVEIIDQTGLDIVGDDVRVIVRAGKTGELTFDADHIRQHDAGYFKYEENSTTIVADFSGTIDGLYTDGIIRVFDDAAPGNSYKLNFAINRPDNVNPGDIQIGDGFTIDATITIKDENKIIDPNEPDDNIIVDDMRPVDGSGTGEDPGKDPNDPNQGEEPTAGGPVIKSEVEAMVLGQPYDIVDAESTPVIFSVTSETGITEFKIEIDSTTLTPDELEGVGLTNNLDLINPVKVNPETGEIELDYEAKLNNLGFPTRDDVKGKTLLTFDISQFVPLLNMLGSGDHQFKLTVSDESGTSKATVYLRN